MSDRKILKESTYTFKVTHYEDGKIGIRRINDGFDPFALLGILDFTRGEIVQQIKGEFKPDVVKREVVVDAVEPEVDPRESLETGDRIEFSVGILEGVVATVVSVVPEGWRVVSDSGVGFWLSNSSEWKKIGFVPVPAKPPEGAKIQITSGNHKGRRATVLNLTDSGYALVKLAGGGNYYLSSEDTWRLMSDEAGQLKIEEDL